MLFQDHEGAQELVDIENRNMFFREFGSGTLLAKAQRVGSQWNVERFDGEDGVARLVTASKEAAIDFMLGR
jgi:hypothetical protein